jgi:hypothetical protein
MFDWMTFISSLGASGIVSLATVHGLAGLLRDRLMLELKATLDKEFEGYRSSLEQDHKVKEAKVGHRIYVTKIHFDTEFSSLKDCFDPLGKVRLAFNGLRPEIDFLPDGQTAQVERIKERFETFRARYEVFVDVLQTIYPFVPLDIHEQFLKCAQAALLEIRTIQQEGDGSLLPHARVKGAERRERFEAAYQKAATLVRERLAHLSVIPE